jgi:hypothetical protein
MQWTLKQAGHLLRRATFGFTPSQLQQALADGPQKTIDRLLATPTDYAQFEQSMAAITSREASPLETAQLVLYRLMHTPWPLYEKARFLGMKPHDVVNSPADYRSRVKTPIEFALNLAIAFEVQLAPAKLCAQLAALGQNLLEHPIERRWLNTFTLVGRSNLAADVLAKVERFPVRQTIIDTLLQDDAPPAVLAKLAALEGRDLAQAIADLPEFQML